MQLAVAASLGHHGRTGTWPGAGRTRIRLLVGGHWILERDCNDDDDDHSGFWPRKPRRGVVCVGSTSRWSYQSHDGDLHGHDNLLLGKLLKEKVGRRHSQQIRQRPGSWGKQQA